MATSHGERQGRFSGVKQAKGNTMDITTNTVGKHNHKVRVSPFAPSGQRRFPAVRIVDSGKVRLGAQGPLFRRAPIADAGAVRLGAQGPLFRAAFADSGKVRLGAQGPLFR